MCAFSRKGCCWLTLSIGDHSHFWHLSSTKFKCWLQMKKWYYDKKYLFMVSLEYLIDGRWHSREREHQQIGERGVKSCQDGLWHSWSKNWSSNGHLLKNMPKYSVDWARASPFTPKIVNSSPVSNIQSPSRWSRQISKTECTKLGD